MILAGGGFWSSRSISTLQQQLASDSQFPGLGHHDTEVFVRVDRGGHIFVIVAEFVESDDSIGDLGVPKAHELAIGLLGSFLAIHDIWVLAHIVDASYIIKGHLPVLIDIKLVIGLTNETETRLAEITAQRSQELIEIDSA